MTTKNANSYSSHVPEKTIYFSKNSSEDFVGFFFSFLLDRGGSRREEKESEHSMGSGKVMSLHVEEQRRSFSWTTDLLG